MTDAPWPTELLELYAAQRIPLVRLGYLLTGDREVAEELVHDAFLATRSRWSDVATPKAYLRTAVTNRARSWLRRLQLQRERERPGEAVQEAEVDELWDALERLDERRRTAIVLRFYQDLPDSEIADVLNCKPATVRTLIHRGLHDLRQEVAR